MKTAEIGSVSTGTLRTEDLVEAYAEALEKLLKKQTTRFKRAPYRAALRSAAAWERKLFNPPVLHDDLGVQIAELLGDLLQDFAPSLCYFGAHEGNASDFGFWPSDGSIDDFDGPRVQAGDPPPRGHLGEYLSVTDHGNLSLMVATRTGTREIWSIV